VGLHVYFTGQISTWNIWFEHIQRIFMEKNYPNSADFWIFSPNCHIFNEKFD
jgi:hypothetical protein